MLEAISHAQLKSLLLDASYPWHHNLTLGRVIGRSLRREDNTFIHLDIGSRDYWWPGLLVPLSFSQKASALILSDSQKKHLIQFEVPRLREKGMMFTFWEGYEPPPNQQIWLLNHCQLINAYKKEQILPKQLIFLDSENLISDLRDSMTINIKSKEWESLISNNQIYKDYLIDFYERISRKIFRQSSKKNSLVRLDFVEVRFLKDCLGKNSNVDTPWSNLFTMDNSSWVSWAELNHELLTWVWKFKPLDPIHHIKSLFLGRVNIFISSSSNNNLLKQAIQVSDCHLKTNLSLGSPGFEETISLRVPKKQPLPNSHDYLRHAIHQSEMLIDEYTGITIFLINDEQLLKQLTANLAAKFGTRVVYQTIRIEINGVLCATFDWWSKNYHQIPFPDQIIIGLLPIPSLEDPLIAAEVELLKLKGKNWFREFLLPEALTMIQKAVLPLRETNGILLILDGRMRTRSWGEEFFKILEPWCFHNRIF